MARATDSPSEQPSPLPLPLKTFPVAEWLLVLLSFAVFASLRSPVPGVNEPHYLTKAKHFWDASWCGRDPFLQSANAHLVFYGTVGVLTRFCSLELTAWIGRWLGWILLSSSWTVLAGRLLPFRWGAVWSAWLFLLFAAIGNWSGEWVVGGIEAKVLSYGCGWWSLACALSGQPIRAAAWSGAAVSFHPVVGIWNTAAVAFALFVPDWRIWRVIPQINWWQLAGSGLAWLALASPGLIPALLMVRGADPNQAYQADYIQVFHRLSHHLDPWKFSPHGYWGYAALLGLSAVLYFRLEGTPRWNLAARYILAAAMIALAGIAIRAIPDVARWLLNLNLLPGAKNSLQPWVDCRPRLAGLLKYYPFRLADVAVPWGCALLLTLTVQSLLTRLGIHKTDRELSDRRPTQISWFVFGCCLVAALTLPAIDRNPSRLTDEQNADWADACQWVQRETPPEALCFSATDGWALKWFAHRADYLSHKDCPQDAPGIVAWNERFKLISKWSDQHLADGFSPGALRDFHRLTGIDYLIVRKFGPIDISPIYRNRNYQVYQLPK